MRLLNRSAGRLSRHRRGPVAGLLVILLGLLMAGGLFAAFSSSATAEKSADSLTQAEKIEAGRKLFLLSCATCHGQNGEGVVAEDGKSNLGPSLVGVGAAAAHFQLETGRMPMVQTGKQAPRKPEAFTQDEVDALAAYVASLAPGPSAPTVTEYDLNAVKGLSADEQREAIVRGGKLFLTNCTACHNFEGSGGAMPWGRYAPPLKGVAKQHIYEAMLTGPQQMPVFSNNVLTPEDKRDIIAYIYSVNDREQTPAYGGFGMKGLGPVAEGLIAWLVGIGGLVAFAYWIAAHTARSHKKEDA
ncbi:cytochrome bc1 complex diheme cytochrome c subunit [Nocardioides jiangxiensis]|uniref:Cytochrome bc1 complex cytochrome c subunit n=1 Tax=Nocardioides jiangxiensis TaxID=3064524 RepID=A0ABT9B343_9ACTN|nr:c-type cytochrome [Nocardioides sp. WY-20]MDO7869270.1 c-type cytochrome [Nocardioides sp. WY-20]